MNLRKLYHKNKPRDKNIAQNMNIYFVEKMLGNVTFLKIEMLKRYIGSNTGRGAR